MPIPENLRLKNRRAHIDPTNAAALDADKIMAILDLLYDNSSGQTGLKLPIWTTAGRPSSPQPGTLGFNSDISQPELWDGSDWIEL